METRTGRIDQIVFRWTARSLIGHSGVGPDATSLDDEEMRQKKALLVVVTVIILPISLVWAGLYLGLGTPAGITALVYFIVALVSLVVFAGVAFFYLLHLLIEG